MLDYLKQISTAKQLLWSYLIWYSAIAIMYFDPTPGVWVAAIGMSCVVGLALVLSTCSWPVEMRSLKSWQTFRLFLIPFCVSSYSSLIKGKGFFLVFPPALSQNLAGFTLVGGFLLLTFMIKKNVA